MLESLQVPGPVRSVVERWDTVVRELPDRAAVTSAAHSFTFSEADVLADRVAAALLGDADRVGAPIGLLAGQHARAVVGLLGVLKAGEIYVSLDPHLPVERLRGICELAGILVCLVDQVHLGLADELGGSLQRVLCLDELLDAPAPTSPPVRAPAADRSSGQDGAAIVFTSGSTGRPKGVIQTHDLILNDALAGVQRVRMVPEDRVALVLPYGFAAGLNLLFMALLNGAGVWSYDPRDGGVRRLLQWITEHRLTTLHSTPHLLRGVVSALEEGVVLDSLRLVCTVGEAVQGRDVAAIRPHLNETASFMNWTGSSEIGTLTFHEIGPGDPVPEGNVPAGRPVTNRDFLLLGDDGTPVVPGGVGELLAVSDYLSGGYWGDPENNASRFTTAPDGRRACRQGDLARVEDTGALVLLGRGDSAVKVRGYLVEPAEIEAALLSLRGVTEAVVSTVVQPGAPTRLVAYVVPDPGMRTQSPAALRRGLRERLPEYMVPRTIVQLAELPRNERGKVDRPRLPEVLPQPPSDPPTTQLELVLAGIWQQVLSVEAVGLDDDFTALGGDSLSAEEILSEVQERLGVDLVSSDLVQTPTLRRFTERVALGKEPLPSHPDVVTLRASGTRQPVYCFAGAGALALTFLPLSRHLVDRPVYAFQAHGLERRGVPDWTVASAARRYLEIIRIIQPRGPYAFVGHSFGGLVALAVAQLLTDAHETVSFVALLDTYLPTTVAADGVTFAYEPLPDRRHPGHRSDVLRRVWQEPIQRVLPDGLPALRQWPERTRGYLAGMVRFKGQRQFDALFDHATVVSRRHVIRPYQGRALMVFAEANPDGPGAWEPFLRGPHTFAGVAAEHASLLREPHATEVGAILTDALADPPGRPPAMR